MWQGFQVLNDRYADFHTPFLGLRARLSQAWAAPAVLIAVLFLVKLQVLRLTIQGFIDVVESGTVDLCIAANHAAASMAEAPKTSAQLANTLIEKSIDATTKSLLELLAMIFTALEQILLFIVELSIGTWACLTVSFVNIAANEALNATESVVEFANKTVHLAINGVEDGLNELSHLINGATGLIGTIETFITGTEKQITKVNLTVENLQNLNIPVSINSKLEGLRDDIPTYDGVKTVLEDTISIPFNLLKTQIRSTNLSFQSRLASPAEFHVSQVCSVAEISTFYAKCAHVADIAVHAFTAVLCIGIVSLIFYSGYAEYRKWNRLSELAATHSSSWAGYDEIQTEMNTMAALSSVESNSMKRLADRLAQKLGGSNCAQRPLISWYIHYITYPPAFHALVSGLVILVLCLFEYIVVAVVVSEATKATASFARSGNQTATVLKQGMEAWQASTNSQIKSFQTQLNSEVFGWVTTSTQTVNDTLSKFMTTMNDEIDHAFGDTPLYKPLAVVVDCLIGNKIEKLEKGLTWVHEHAHVSLPRIDVVNNATKYNTTKMNSALEKFNSTFPVIANSLYSQILTETVVGACFVGVWVLFALGAGIYLALENQDYDTSSINGSVNEEKLASTSKRRATRVFGGPNRKPRLRHPSNASIQYGQWNSSVDPYPRFNN